MSASVSVVIAGAGPVGLSLGLALSRAGIDVEIVEREAGLGKEARASTLHPPTLEMFAEWGVLQSLLARGRRIRRLQYWERASRRLVADFSYRLIEKDTACPFRLQCPQHQVTPVLRQALEGTGRARLHFNHALEGFRQLEDRVEVELSTPQGARSLVGRFLCGADGAHSRVRETLGLGFTGKTYQDRFLLVSTDLDMTKRFPGMGPVSYIFDPEEWVIVMALPQLVRVVFRLDDSEDEAAALEETALHARLLRLLGSGVDFRVRTASVYSVHQRVAESFRHGRTLLLGDAAHVNNPTGGMGMNSGIHDAHALSRALQSVLEGGGEGALDEYARERKQVAVERVQRDSHHNYSILGSGNAALCRRRNASLAAAAADPQLARAHLLRSSMLEERI